MAYNMEKAKKFPNTICRNVAVFPVISTQEKHVLQVGMKCYQQCSCVHFPRLQWRWLRLSLFRPKSMEYNMRFLLSCACVCGYVDYIQIFMEIANFFFTFVLPLQLCKRQRTTDGPPGYLIFANISVNSCFEEHIAYVREQ